MNLGQGDAALNGAVERPNNEYELGVLSHIPLHLRNAPTQLMKELNYGDGYRYPHDFPGNFVSQQYLPDECATTRFWYSGSNTSESRTAEHLRQLWGDRFDKEG